MGEFHKSLKGLARCRIQKEKGRAFEEHTSLSHVQPFILSQIENIWHHEEIPQYVIDELVCHNQRLVSIWFMYENTTYWAVQCKFKQNPDKNISYSDLSTFFDVTGRAEVRDKFSHRLVCVSTNSVSKKVNQLHKTKIGYITRADLKDLEKDYFDNFRQILAGKEVKVKPLKPYKHQLAAVQKCKNHFFDKSAKRGKIIHPCGSGKSVLSYWILVVKGKNCLSLFQASLVKLE